MDVRYITRDVVFNQHNVYLWEGENPHGVVYHCFSANVWVDVIGYFLLGHYLLLVPLTYANYRIFSQEVLQSFLDTSAQHIRYIYSFYMLPTHYDRYVPENAILDFGN